jgi:predicted transposase/invertase (TIGR01784 family)
MQMELGSDDLLARASFYATRLLSGQTRRGEDYKDIKRVYQIFFINRVLYPRSLLFPRRYHMREDTEHDKLNDLIEVAFYELPKLEGKVQSLLAGREEVQNLPEEEKWGIYMRYHQEEGKESLIQELIREDGGIMSTEKVLNRVSQEYEEWAKALFREKAEMDYRSGMHNAERKGYEQGLEKGLEQGLEKGLEQGREEAVVQIQAAVQQEKLAAIARLREMGVSEEIIAASFPGNRE